jgi:hypothetical protein
VIATGEQTRANRELAVLPGLGGLLQIVVGADRFVRVRRRRVARRESTANMAFGTSTPSSYAVLTSAGNRGR